jgi:hypothetical protein
LARNIAASKHELVVKTAVFPEGSRMFNTQGQSTCAHLQDTGLTHPEAGPIVWQGGAQCADSRDNIVNRPACVPDRIPIENL